MKFRLLPGNGGHSVGDVLHTANAVIESNSDLCSKFNTPVSRKFERVPDETPCSPGGSEIKGAEVEVAKRSEQDEATLRGMGMTELKAIAEQEEIDVSKCKNKDEVVRAIATAMAAA